jgi:hypothetical protein
LEKQEDGKGDDEETKTNNSKTDIGEADGDDKKEEELIIAKVKASRDLNEYERLINCHIINGGQYLTSQFER